MIMIEAMACGTPVIAFPRGSVPEIIDDGVTGFIVADVGEAAAAVGRLQTLDRAAIRRRFEERFTAARMARDYVELYRQLRGRPRPDARAITLQDVPSRMPDSLPSTYAADLARIDGGRLALGSVEIAGLADQD